MSDEVRQRREPPRLRPVTVARTEARSPHLRRVTLVGDELAGLELGLPASSVRLLLPDPGADAVELPTWNGNEFLRADGTRARLRTLTPLRLESGVDGVPELDVEVVLHDRSPLTAWAEGATPGTPAAVSGTGAGYAVDPGCTAFVVAGDESALPAITTLLPALPSTAQVTVLIEVRHADAALELPMPAGAVLRWCVRSDGEAPGDALVDAVVGTPIPDGAAVWAAGEAAAVQRLRKHLAALGVPRSATSVRGYWKHGREGT